MTISSLKTAYYNVLKPCRDPMGPDAFAADAIRKIRKNNGASAVMIEDTRIEEEDDAGYLVEVFWYETEK